MHEWEKCSSTLQTQKINFQSHAKRLYLQNSFMSAEFFDLPKYYF